MRDRTVQFLAAAAAAMGVTAAGTLLPRVLDASDRGQLRYTNVSVEGAPPIVALGSAVGALRGLVVDYLWIRLQQMRQEGQYYDARRLAELITKLQPRFGEVWAFHGHNLAYNLSVAMKTPEERWRLVNAGIDLVRGQGIRYNPNDLILYKELGWWFAHKIDGLSDDAHFHYKRELAREWHLVLGEPPESQEARAAWLDAIADAPDTWEELVARDPGVESLVEAIRAKTRAVDPEFRLELDRDFLMALGRWNAVKSGPGYARIFGLHDQFRRRDPMYAAIDDVLSEPERRASVVRLAAWLRKRVLLDVYNMDPRVMARYTREFGPFDWRHPQAHAFYWTKLGSEVGAERYDNDEDVYRILNDDRTSIQAMQSLAHSGLMRVDPLSQDNPARLYDSRWIPVIDRYFRDLYRKHYETRGGGPDTFVDFYENFMAQAVRELYHAGETEEAQRILDQLDELCGRGGLVPNNKYVAPLDVFVRNSTFGEYEQVPDVARTDVAAILRRGFLEGYLLGRQKVLDEALAFARDLTEFFRTNRYTDFRTRMGDARLADMIGSLERSVEDVLAGIMRDPSIPLVERLTIYNRLPEDQRAMVYDAALRQIETDWAASPFGASGQPVSSLFAEPPNMDAYRARQAEQERERAERLRELREGAADRRR
ncbi:MAG: hypothetical protein RI990_1166 [Planctomycetota bacterium]|jgi:hypothetical protein